MRIIHNKINLLCIHFKQTKNSACYVLYYMVLYNLNVCLCVFARVLLLLIIILFSHFKYYNTFAYYYYFFDFTIDFYLIIN